MVRESTALVPGEICGICFLCDQYVVYHYFSLVDSDDEVSVGDPPEVCAMI